jgi:hypothetical protein
MKDYDIELLKQYRKLYIGERTLIDVWGDIYENKYVAGGRFSDGYTKTIKKKGYIKAKYTLEISYEEIKIHKYENGKYNEIIIPYKDISDVSMKMVNVKMSSFEKRPELTFNNGYGYTIIRFKHWDKKRVQELVYYLIWASRAQRKGIVFDDEKEIEERNRRIRKKRIEQGKKYENEETIIAVLFILFIIGFILAVVREFIIIGNNM